MAESLLNHLDANKSSVKARAVTRKERSIAPPLDVVITVCDNAAGEVCPIWPGLPVTAHWGIADPAAVHGSEEEKLAAFRTAFRELDSRIKILARLPLRSLDRNKLQERLNAIGAIARQSG